MSLSLDVLRWLTVRAIRGRTWAGDRVFDSPATPADIRTESEREPFIAVYVDDADWDFGPHYSGLVVPSGGEVKVTIEAGVSSARRFNEEDDPVDLDVPDPRGTYVVNELNATDEGLEAQIGFLTRQAIQAILSTAETNPWAELWRSFVGSSIEKVTFRRGGPGDEMTPPKPRFASRVTTIHINALLAEPVRGADLDQYEFWPTLLAAFEGDEEYQGLGELLRMHFVAPAGALPEWRIGQKLLSVPRSTMRHLGISPYVAGDETAPPLAKVANPTIQSGDEPAVIP